MQNIAMQTWLDSSYLSSTNRRWIEELYKDFLIDPNSVEKNWRFVFQQFSELKSQPDQLCSEIHKNSTHSRKDATEFSYFSSDFIFNTKQGKVLELINAYRSLGHRCANLDPLGLKIQDFSAVLDPACFNLTKRDYKKKFGVGSFAIRQKNVKLEHLIHLLRRTYCGSIGAEYMHISSMKEKCWIQERIESVAGQPLFTTSEKIRFLSELTAAEEFERYLGTKFPGAKRFSLEGGDSLIPMLKELIRHSATNGTKVIVLGMTHRGRLNVLVNVFGKKPKDLFDEFSGKHRADLTTGDLKHHMGFSSDLKTESGLVHLSLAFNPSHLEIISPVVIGSARARLEKLKKPDTNEILPITIHGDAAIIGQGVVQETLNISKTKGYDVGGMIFIVINNQVGFTTSNYLDSRSTLYCTDIGKIVQAPIFHANADDPEAVVFVTRLSLDYRRTFRRDVFVDLFCYRRHGHNEVDAPCATQPIMYQKIKQHPTSRKIYAQKLVEEKIVSLENSAKMVQSYREALETGECVVKELQPMRMHSFTWSPYLHPKLNEHYPNRVEVTRLKELAKSISTVPDIIKMESSVEKIYADRQAMAEGKRPLDWGFAEILSFATLVDVGISIRLSGEDVGRGTFFQRQAVVHSQIDGISYIPLQNVHKHQGQFKVWDSALSEEAVLAFEYGYATASPQTLNIWEAQFGDFSNVAQVVIDQFIASGEKKWGRMCGLVMLLPHGYEGQGPEHSSARLERYLQLCAEQNMQVCIPSTPAQVYHMLRRQALRHIRRPLVVMSPKSLLRHPLVVSTLEELANTTFFSVIGEIDELDLDAIQRVIFCSGKVYYDLLGQRRKNRQNNVAIVRIEQLYPFPFQEIEYVLKFYENVCDFVWCQEEPLNQGAWYFSRDYFRKVIPFGSSLRYEGRPASAVTAVGHLSVHKKQQRDLINNALNVNKSKET